VGEAEGDPTPAGVEAGRGVVVGPLAGGGGAGVTGAGTATAAAVAAPTTSSDPAGKPACSAIKRTRRPVTALSAERGAADDVALDSTSTSSVPQSASGSWRLGAAATGWPSATRPVIADDPTSPEAPAEPAAAPARIETDSATTSPPSIEIASARTEPSAEDDVPACDVALAVEAPTRSAEPSSGYENGPPTLAVGGAASWPVELDG
jgi:hypothetical protein